jgi:hypothetical protein
MAEIFEKNVDYPSGVKPFTRAVIPAANLIRVGGKFIGYVQNIDPTQDRPATEQYEVGSIGPVELIPGQPKYSYSLSHVKVYTNSIMQTFMDLSYAEQFGETAVKDAIQGQMVGDQASKNVEVFNIILHNILPITIEVWELNFGVDAQGNPIDFNLDEVSKDKLKTRYVDGWITSYSKPINQGNINVVETMNVSCRKISMSK